MQIFFTPPAQVNDFIWLSEEEARHCKVLRKQKNEVIHLIDGQGAFYKAKIIEIKKKVQIQIIEKKQYPADNYHIHLALSPTKSIDRIEWLIEKSVEIGVHQISFFISEHSERKKIKLERLEKIALSAAKQSKTFFLPKIEEIVSFEKFLANDFSNKEKYIAYLGDEKSSYLLKMLEKQKNYLILIGAEGGFSPFEAELAQSKGFEWVNLGEKRLRTETAALVACQLCQVIQHL